MCTYNGARFLREQLDSIAAQKGVAWHLVVSDDGSRDATCAIVQDFASAHPVTLFRHARDDSALAPSQRAARNYLRTLTRPDLPVGPDTFVALSDQDDIWRPDKLAHGVRVLLDHGAPVAVYSGQSRHIRADGAPLVPSRPPHRPPALGNALVQNVVSGHSTILTPAAFARLRLAGVPEGVFYHDWWIYLLMAATGAKVIVDGNIGLDYRQHSQNVMGAGQGGGARAKRLRQMFNGEYGRWFRANLDALAKSTAPLTPEARSAIETLSSGPMSPRRLWQAGVYRQRPLETCCLHLAGMLHKI